MLKVEQQEVDELLEICEEAETWLVKKIKEQATKEAWEEPAFRSDTATRKHAQIEKTLHSFFKRKPRPPPAPPAPANNTAAAAETNGTVLEDVQANNEAATGEGT